MRLGELTKNLASSFPGAKWTRPQGFHITLKFLGNIPSGKVAETARALGTVEAKRFEAEFDRIGFFPSGGKARVLWVGLGRGAAESKELYDSVESALSPVGFGPEEREFKAHLTLARFKTPVRAPREIADASVGCPSFTAAKFVLYKSTLTPGGAIYTPLAEYELG